MASGGLEGYTQVMVSVSRGAQRFASMFGMDVPVSEKAIRKNVKQIMLYKCLAVALVVAWSCILDFRWSCLVTISEMIQAAAFALLLFNVVCARSVAGISKKMLGLHVLATVCRSQSTLFYYGYLPYFGWGSVLFPVFDIGVAAIAVYLLVLMSRYSATYSATADTFWVFWMAPVAIAIAYLTHPHANRNTYADTMWATSQWLDGLSMLPQIWMARQGHSFGAVASHFVALMFVARFVCLVYWSDTYSMLKIQEYQWGFGVVEWFYPGYFVLAASVLQVLSMADFMYFYIAKAAERSGSSLLALGGKFEL